MTPEILAQHEFDNGEPLQLLRPQYGGKFKLVGSFGGLEVPIHFDRVDVQRNQLVLSREAPDGPPSQHVAAGALEGGPRDYGDVGEALHRIAHTGDVGRVSADV